MAYDLETLDLTPPTHLEFQAFRPLGKSESVFSSLFSELLVLRFSGEYPPGSKGNSHARYISAMTLAAVVSSSPCCVILDFSKLTYRWGNALLQVFQDFHSFVHEPDEDDLPLLVVTGEKSREALLSLLTPAGSAAPPSWHFDDLEAAIDAGLVAAKEWLDA